MNEARATRTRAATKSGSRPRSVPAQAATGRLRTSQLPPGTSSTDALRYSVAGTRPSQQVPVRDGMGRLTGSPALSGEPAHHRRQGLRPSAASKGAATNPARPGMVPLRPMPISAQIQRCGGIQCPPGTCDHDQGETAHRSGEATPGPAQIPPSVAKVLGTPGQALDASTRSRVEEQLGHDFGHVRLHADAEAARSAHAIHAQAYTLGRHVVMGQGRYQPHTASGMQLLVHELIHVIQQGNPAANTGPARAISHHHDPAEREADHIARALTGSPGASAPSGLLQRQDDDGTSTPVTDDGTSEYSMSDIEWMPQVTAGYGSGAGADQSSVQLTGGLPAASSSASPEITLETGNNASSSSFLNNALHQQVCVVTGVVPGKDCYSFAATGLQAPEFSSTWLGWSDLVIGDSLQGTVYSPDPVSGASVASRLTPTAAQAVKWDSYMVTRLGLQDGYTVADHNCRKFSQFEFRDAPSHW